MECLGKTLDNKCMKISGWNTLLKAKPSEATNLTVKHISDMTLTATKVFLYTSDGLFCEIFHEEQMFPVVLPPKQADTTKPLEAKKHIQLLSHTSQVHIKYPIKSQTKCKPT